MLERYFEYKGRQVEIVIDGDEAGDWGWAYIIDAGKLTPGEVRISRGATDALAYARARAMREIDTTG